MISDADLQSELSEHATQAVALSTSFVLGFIMFCFEGFSIACCLQPSIQVEIIDTSRFSLKQERVLE